MVLAVIFCFANVSTAAVQIGKQANNPSGKFSSPKSVGVRVGYGAEMSYQHYLGKNFLELDLGLIGLDPNIHAIAVYNFTCIEWGSRGRWHLYAGPGLGCGYGKHFKGYDENFQRHTLTSFNAGLVGQVGVEYTFRFPLQISIDYRPMLGVCVLPDKSVSFYAGSIIPALSIRYNF